MRVTIKQEKPKLRSARRVVVTVLISMAASGVSHADDSDPATLLTTLFERAGVGDSQGVQALSTKVAATHSPEVAFAYHLARYIADPKSYAAQFVAEFPEDYSGIMGAVYELELRTRADGKSLTPRSLYSFDALGDLAEREQPGALRKLFLVAGNADGVVTEFVCERVIKVLVSQPAKSVEILGSLERGQRKKTYVGCFDSISMDEQKAARNSIGSLAAGKSDEISKEILAALE